jgi:1-acyl-sn-glycerol-3-phosphate acyltransferase
VPGGAGRHARGRSGPARSCEYAPVLEVLCRVLAQATVKLFYPDRVIDPAGLLPPGGPVVYISNHVNGLMDPLLVRVVVGRPAGFLAKSTLFGNPFGRLAMAAFGCVLIHRAHDGGGKGVKSRAAANDAAFARCRQALSRGEALALFPEGVSHSDPRLRPLKRGAARIALSAAREHRERTGEPLGLLIVPLGLGYRDKTRFRSPVQVAVGDPIPVPEPPAGGDDRAAEDALTARMQTALQELVTRASRPPGPLPERSRLPGRWRRALGTVIRILPLAPLALIGAAVGGLPCRLARHVAHRITDEEDMVATLKMLAGATFLFLACLAAGVVAACTAGPAWGPVAFTGAVGASYVGLVVEERLREVRQEVFAPGNADDGDGGGALSMTP